MLNSEKSTIFDLVMKYVEITKFAGFEKDLLFFAAEKDIFEIFESIFIIYKDKFNIGSIDKYVLNEYYKIAVINNSYGIVEILIKQANFDINNNVFHYLIHAVQKNNLKLVKMLLGQDRLDVNILLDSNSALIIACKFDYKNIVKVLLKHPKIDTTIKNSDG